MGCRGCGKSSSAFKMSVQERADRIKKRAERIAKRKERVARRNAQAARIRARQESKEN